MIDAAGCNAADSDPAQRTCRPKVVVLGIGSPLGLDALSWDVVERLKSTLCLNAWEISFRCLDRPGPGLLDQMAGYEAAVLLDAWLAEEATAPQVFSEQAWGDAVTAVSTHALGVVETLALGKRLGLLPNRLYLVGLPVNQSVEALAQPVLKLMEEWFDSEN